MGEIKRFFECLLPVTACNLKCGYCYVIQRNNRMMKMPEMKYSAKRIGAGLSQERLGGKCYFSICGTGETLLPEIAVDIAYEILKQGHYINFTTNGTISKRIDQLMDFPEEYRGRMHFAFSLHYLELVRLNKLEVFWSNIKKIKRYGCSFLVQLNLCDEYVPYIEEIKQVCMKEVGALPQIAATRKENNLSKDVELLTKHTVDEYIAIGQHFRSPLFDFTMKNFGVKQKGFCYAGDWTGQINLGTGVLSRCYCSLIKQDIFEDIKKPIHFCAIGAHCNSLFCMNSSHFLSLGAIPSVFRDVTYATLRNREEAAWYTDEMKSVLDSKLCEQNQEYTWKQKILVAYYAFLEYGLKKSEEVKRIIKKVIIWILDELGVWRG